MNELLMNQVEEVSGGYRVGSFGIARDALQRGLGALPRQMVNDCLANPNCYAAGNGGDSYTGDPNYGTLDGR